MPTTLTTPAGAKWVGRHGHTKLLSLMATVVKVGMFIRNSGWLAVDVFFVFFSADGVEIGIPFHWFPPPCMCWHGFQVFGMLSFTSVLVKYPGWYGR